MNIFVLDSQGILSDEQKSNVTNRLMFALARFHHRVNGATMHFSLDESCQRVDCTVYVNVEGAGVAFIKRSSNSSDEAASLAVNAIEPKVAWHVDWRSLFNADTFATWLHSVLLPFSRRSGSQSPTV